MTRFRTGQRSRLGETGQAMIETLIIFWFAFSLLMVVIQIALIFNAQSVVKLAAMNAARTAAVARLEDKMEEPVTQAHMVDQARKAAFLTIVPVIPGAHGRTGRTSARCSGSSPRSPRISRR
jgi:Flp pilus assembly protein TadG